MGWLGASIIPAKILIQKLWLKNLNWNDKIDEDLEKEWLILRKSFKQIKNVEIPRWIDTECEDSKNVTLHGFCDASNKAYCAVVYCRIANNKGEIKTNIIASRTRVAPVKPLSLPRLELCGAVILARLLTHIREAMRLSPTKVFAWTDSSVVLSWLFGDPNRWKPFVSNRVVEILDNLCNTQWFHVKTNDNPADIGSRGMNLQQLIQFKQWWEGPAWLKEKNIEYSRPNLIPTDIERIKNIQVNLKTETKKQRIKLENFDSLQELLKVVVYCSRFINSKKQPDEIRKNITTEEYENALLKCVRIVQKREYEEDIKNIRMKVRVKKGSSLKSLNPFLDTPNILRVGGRLQRSELTQEQKHPIILSSSNHLTSLLIADAHKKTLHGGIQLMLCYLRNRFWIIRAKNAIKFYIRNCIVCARQRATIRTQIMGELPKARVTPARPFLHSGVDFAGPLQVLHSKGRGAKTSKAYIAIFVCMVTKAIHLELVGDLTAESFIGAFHRFVARRGKCSHIWSDQGRNFVGANKDLADAWKQARLEIPGYLIDTLALDGTQWHFIPPHSPNFGGLWEAGVKSTKYHLRRIMTRNLTQEEMTTVLCQIEACLNSRPLVPIDTEDVDVIDPLTPGHFLIGEAPILPPSPDLRDINASKLTRWQFTQKIVRDFWQRWHTEYLSRLQERTKWIKRESEYEIGDIVLLKDDNLPPGKWLLGRIMEKYPGPDGIARVYGVKCGTNILKRSISKLCALPIESK
ncbi:unnamed protein product [Parnassius mnemosyne]|uniref:Integrase catalytic domain-containing protein n=1 Tax=Parnassius mnemosyne TaxID=213953 RepID=A0AAV1LJX2_9NEOP